METSLRSQQSHKRANHPQILFLREEWTLVSAAEIPDFNAIHKSGWTHPESHITSVPQTVFGALVEDGTIVEPFFGKNLESCDNDPYTAPWIYRKEFNLDPDLPADFVELTFEGINYRANVWLNGSKIADAADIESPFRIYSLDVTQLAKPSGNVLVVEAIPPAKDDLTIGWVDWNPYPPDNNLGLWRPVKLRQSGPVSLEGLCIRTQLDLDSLQHASIEISAKLINRTNSLKSGEFRAKIEDREVCLSYELNGHESSEITLNAESHPDLAIDQPRIWWPHLMGEQPLYNVHASVVVDQVLSDEQEERFGIRHVEDYINEQGHRGWKVNGKKILIRGGGWRDDLFLRESEENLEAQVRYTRHMNLNTIRLEGFWGSSQALFDLCDEYGILLLIGWSCHWEWEGYCNRKEDGYLLIKTAEEIEFQSESFKEQAIWLRNHPSVLMWVFGSDMIPRPDLERALRRKLEEVDPGRPCLAGCRQRSQDGEEDFTSEVSGHIGVKMMGPYSYTTPNYWFEDRQIGGAYGFNAETGPGLQPTVYESLCRFTPKENLWPIDDVWAYHTGRREFSTFDFWLPAFNARYGESENAEDFCFRAQMSNYEAIRAMFEAFAINKPEATGVIQWMLNSSMPNHLWQLYDYYLMPTGAFYGTRQACQPLNVVYNPVEHAIYLTNELLEDCGNLSLHVSVFDTQSRLLWEDTAETTVCSQSAHKVTSLPELVVLPGSTYFLDLRIQNEEGNELARNFYWLSAKKDICDYESSDFHHTPNTQFADLTGLRDLPWAMVSGQCRMESSFNDAVISVDLYNDSEYIAFFIELGILDSNTGNTIVPVYWDDNYISLLPGEKRTISAKLDKGLISGGHMACRIVGANVPYATLPW